VTVEAAVAGPAEGALLALTVVCLVANLVIVAAKLAGAAFVLDNVREVGLDREVVPVLAGVQGLGVAGLAAGLLGLEEAGLLAAAGLALFFVIATAAHVRARVLHSIGFPLVFLALAAVAAAHFLTRL
jgi:hypothetical protein